MTIQKDKMTDHDVMNLLDTAMKAAKENGFELFAVLADPNKEGTYSSWQPLDEDNPIFNGDSLQEMAFLYAQLFYFRNKS